MLPNGWVIIALCLGQTAVDEGLALGENIDAVTSCSAKVHPEECPTDAECTKLPLTCRECECPTDCDYGKTSVANCTVPASISCKGQRSKSFEFKCRYCYQTALVSSSASPEFECRENFDCSSNSGGRGGVQNSPDLTRNYYLAECTVEKEVICLGRRTFHKQTECNWTSGYKWSTALALSVFLGGFGADRFYLGHWQEGIGKLFSFGGLGVWTLVDVVMVAIKYVGPSDGSLYI